jgi:hypothetical protein
MMQNMKAHRRSRSLCTHLAPLVMQGFELSPLSSNHSPESLSPCASPLGTKRIARRRSCRPRGPHRSAASHLAGKDIQDEHVLWQIGLATGSQIMLLGRGHHQECIEKSHRIGRVATSRMLRTPSFIFGCRRGKAG